MNIENNIDALLKRVEKPARYIGGELNSVYKERGTDPNQFQTRFVFAFPDTYEIGMSYMGLQILYSLLNELQGVFCERVFAPAEDMEKLMRQNSIPLFSLESKQPVADADIIGFTLQYELSYTNILNMLDLAGIPLKSADRNENHPFVIAGGPCAFNPEPMAEFIDFFIIGDGEEVISEVMQKNIIWKASGRSRIEFLKDIAELKGVYIPRFYDPVYDSKGSLTAYEKNYANAPDRISKRIVANLNNAPFPSATIVPYIETVHNRAVVEIFRGCIRGCRFCQAGMIYRPVRERSPESIKKIAIEQLENSGFDELSILSLSTSDYCGIDELVTDLMKICKEHQAALSLPSLRLDSFSLHILKEMQGYRKTGLTFAPEAGTQRLRDVINKSITDENIYHAIEQASELGWFNFKFYFMIGLPTETDEDLDGIVEIAANVAAILRSHKTRSGRSNITISVSNFVPKPHTPFQWMPQCSRQEFDRKHHYLKERLRNMRNVTFSYHGTESSYLEAVFARGDRQIGKAILYAWQSGCKFDSWHEYFNYAAWLDAFGKAGLNPDNYAMPKLNYESALPWDIIDSGISKDFLIQENERSIKAVKTPNCREKCSNCGILTGYECNVYAGERA